jgi:hypothetical protein
MGMGTLRSVIHGTYDFEDVRRERVSIKHLLRKIWWGMPIDGAGLMPFGSPLYRQLRKACVAYRWRIVPRWCRPMGWGVTRFLWLFVCPIQVYLAVSKSASPIPWRVGFQTLKQGWLQGKSPYLFIKRYPSLGTGEISQKRLKMILDMPDDLQGGLMLAAMGCDKDRQLASDKVLSTNALLQMGLPVAPILMELNTKSSLMELLTSPWMDEEKLFIKPRASCAAQGAMCVQKVTKSEFKVNQATLNQKEFLGLLQSRLSKHKLLVQPFLRPAHSMLDISPDTSPWLRIFVYRSPGKEVQHLSSAIKILQPGRSFERNISKILMAPVDPERGTLLDGVFVNGSAERLSAVPWNGAALRGRFISEFQESLNNVIQASSLFPHSPLIGWDVILSDKGPLILEANLGVSLSRAHLWHYETGMPSPWMDACLAWVSA